MTLTSVDQLYFVLTRLKLIACFDRTWLFRELKSLFELAAFYGVIDALNKNYVNYTPFMWSPNFSNYEIHDLGLRQISHSSSI